MEFPARHFADGVVVLDISLFSTLAIKGILMAPLSPGIVASVFAAAIALAFCLDAVKVAVFGRLAIT